MSFWEWLMGTPAPRGAASTGSRRVGANQRASALHRRGGDVVSYDTVDYVVKNRIVYSDSGYQWFDYMLDAGTGDAPIWLSAEDDDGLELGIYRDLVLPPGIPPVPRTLTLEGKTYTQYEHSTADASVDRAEATRPAQARIEYWEYRGPSGKSATVTRWEGEYEVSVGATIQEYEIRIFPGEAS
jgi:hypothetical protein